MVSVATSLSRTGEGNGNPLQCSCLENPRDGGAWWAAIYAVTQSQTQLKRLSSSSSRGGGTSLLRTKGTQQMDDGLDVGTPMQLGAAMKPVLTAVNRRVKRKETKYKET